MKLNKEGLARTAGLLLFLLSTAASASSLKLPAALRAGGARSSALALPGRGGASAPLAPSGAPALSPLWAAPSAAASAGLEQGESVAGRLLRRFGELDADPELRLAPGGLPAMILDRVRTDLLAFALETEDRTEAPLLETVALESQKALRLIEARLAAGTIDPSLAIRLDPSGPPAAPSGRAARIGVYPVSADPFQWGHLIIALRAIGRLELDKVVFIMQGDDERKPTMTLAETRHPMGLKVLERFAPFFVHSPIAVGTTYDGETNIFRLLALNPGVPVEAWYMVGDDHYRLVDKKGNPDTLPKLEANLARSLGHDGALHRLKVAFIERDLPGEAVPTALEVRLLPHVGFPASSSDARGGRWALVPHTAIREARRLGLYGLSEPPRP